MFFQATLRKTMPCLPGNELNFFMEHTKGPDCIVYSPNDHVRNKHHAFETTPESPRHHVRRTCPDVQRSLRTPTRPNAIHGQAR